IGADLVAYGGLPISGEALGIDGFTDRAGNTRVERASELGRFELERTAAAPLEHGTAQEYLRNGVAEHEDTVAREQADARVAHGRDGARRHAEVIDAAFVFIDDGDGG